MNIRVRTRVGYTVYSEEAPMIGQGTGGGALVSQVNLDKTMCEMFSTSDEEASYAKKFKTTL